MWHDQKISNPRKLIQILFVLPLVAALISCTRAEDDSQSSTLQISVPKSMTSQKVGKLTEEKIAHIVINVSGPGISEPILWNWDIHDQGDGSGSVAVQAPTAVLTVPRGSGRLVQVLAVYQTNVGMSFYYGDSVKSMTNSDETVVVNIASIGSGSLVSGRLNGRYLTAADSGPTGRVMLRYYPPGGQPSIVIDKSIITNGWFSFMMMYADGNVKFGYEVIPDAGGASKLLWGRPVNLLDAEFDPNNASNRLVKVAIPAAYRAEGGGGAPVYRLEQPSVYAYGWFFDPGASGLAAGKSLCRANTLTNLTRFSVNSSGSPNMPGQILSAGQAFPTPTELSAQPNSVGGYKVSGGTYDSSCAGAYTEKINLLSLSAMVDGNGNDGSMYNYPPVKGQPNGSSRSQVTVTKPAPTTYHFLGEFLPGVGANIVDGISVYKRVSNVNIEWNNESMPCNSIESAGAFGFQRVLTYARTTDVFEIDVPVSAAEGTTGTTLAFCYRRGAQLLEAGFFVKQWTFQQNFSPGGGPQGPTLGFKLTGSNLANSQIDFTPALNGDPRTLIYEQLSNGFHMMFPVLINGGGSSSYFTSGSDLTVDIKKMIGGVWGSYTSVGLSAAQTQSGGPTINLSFNPGSVLSASVQKFQLKITVSAAYQAATGLASGTFESPEYTLVTGCSQTSLTARRISPSAVDYNNTIVLNDMFSADTDFEGTYRLVDTTNPTCETADILIDYINQNMNTACWDNMNVRRSDADPFRYIVSPRDRTGANCVVSGGSLSIFVPSNAGSVGISRGSISATLNHGMTFSKVGAYLTDDGSLNNTPINYLHLKLTSFIAGANQLFDFKFMALNADEQIINTASTAGFSATTTVLPATPTNFFASALPNSVSRFSDTTNASPGTNVVGPVLFNGGAGKDGGFSALVSNFAGDIVDVSTRSLAGGSTLFAVSNGAVFDIKFVKSQFGNFIGQSIQTLLTTASATKAQVEQMGMITGGDSFVVMTDNDFYFCAYIYQNSASNCDNGLTAYLNTQHASTTISYKGIYIKDLGNGTHLPFLVYTADGTYKVAWVNMRGYDSSSNAFTGAYSFNGSSGSLNVSGQTYLDLLVDNNVGTIVGRSSSNFFSYVDLPNPGWGGGSLFFSTTGASLTASYDQSKMVVDYNNGNPRRAFLFWASGSTMSTYYPRYIMVDSTSSPCTSSSYVSSGTTTAATDFSTADAGVATGYFFKGAAGGQDASLTPGFFVAYPKTSGTKIGLQFWSFKCTSTVMTLGTNALAVRVGGLPGMNFTGMKYSLRNTSAGQTPSLNIFGMSHVFYGTDIK